MRGTNGPMDVMTRAEFDDSMRNYSTKDDLKRSFAETKAEIVSAIKERFDDLKVDLSFQIDEKVKRSHNLLTLDLAQASDLKDAKNEILATVRRNISEAIAEATAPLVTKADLEGFPTKADLEGFPTKADLEGFATKADLEGLRSDMDHGFLKVASRLDLMDQSIKGVHDGYASLNDEMKTFTAEMRQLVKDHEERLDRHDANFHKLRQSGVLQ
jgi:hypothetical protein